MVYASCEEETDHTRQRTRDNHRTDNHALYVNANVFCGIGAITDNRDLVAMLGVLQIDEHYDRQNEEDQNREEILITEEIREIAVRQRIKDTGRALHPNRNACRHETRCNIVEHKRKERLVGIEIRLEDRRKNAPNRTRNDTRYRHQEDEERIGHLAAEKLHASNGREATDENLSVSAEVPEFHFERRNNRNRHAEQERGILQEKPNTA